MKKLILLLVAVACTVAATAQVAFGGSQASDRQMEYSQKFADVDYVGDGQGYHTLDIYLPKVKKDTYPVVIHIYGSAWFNNNGKGAADLNTICAALLDAGYAVVTPNHRASTDALYPAQIHDIKAVIRFVRGEAKKYGFDTSFVGISGFSSGGHLASLAATTNGLKTYTLGDDSVDLEGSLGKYTAESSLVNAACDWSGPVDLQNMDCGEAMKMPKSPEEVMIGVPMQGNENKYALLSPITFVNKKNAPIHIFHGTKDNVVPVCQGERFYEALKGAGAQCDCLIVPEGGHGFNMYSRENLQRMIDFFAKALSSHSPFPFQMRS